MKTSSLIAIDPGNNTGWAHFRNDVLMSAGVASFENFHLAQRMIFTGDAVRIEAPRHYPHKEKGDVNDLLDLAVRVGRLQEWCEAQGAHVELVWPRTWKGSVPKPIHNRRVLETLSDVELKVLPKSPRARTYNHNMLDAVGLGLWALGRM